VLAKREAEAAVEREKVAARARLRDLGLDPDDLDDDPPPPKLPAVLRHNAPLWTSITEPVPMRLHAQRELIEVGLARPGAWWAAVRKGDTRGAMRLYVRFDRGDLVPGTVFRRERPLATSNQQLAVSMGEARLDYRVAGRGVIAWIEEEDGLVVGLTVSWSQAHFERAALQAEARKAWSRERER
jgi:hypothetical protein